LIGLSSAGPRVSVFVFVFSPFVRFGFVSGVMCSRVLRGICVQRCFILFCVVLVSGVRFCSPVCLWFFDLGVSVGLFVAVTRGWGGWLPFFFVRIVRGCSSFAVLSWLLWYSFLRLFWFFCLFFPLASRLPWLVCPLCTGFGLVLVCFCSFLIFCLFCGLVFVSVPVPFPRISFPDSLLCAGIGFRFRILVSGSCLGLCLRYLDSDPVSRYYRGGREETLAPLC